MNCLFTDFYALSALREKGAATAEEVLCRMSWEMTYPVGLDCLISSLEALEVGGYISIGLGGHDGERLKPDTNISLTDKGRVFLAVRGLSGFTKSGRRRAMRKQLAALLSTERPTPDAASARLTADREAFAAILRDMESQLGDMRLLSVAAQSADVYKLSVHRAFSNGASDESGVQASDESGVQATDDVAVTADLPGIRRMLTDLCDAAMAFCESHRVRKVALIGGGRGYVLTVAEVHSEEAQGSVLRLTVAPILFNRQRFIGKRDSELDYAQCGSPAITVELSDDTELVGLVLAEVMMCPELWDGALAERADALYRKVGSN